MKTEKNIPIIAAVLSFLMCGLGQIYNGEKNKGIYMIFGYAVLGGLNYYFVFLKLFILVLIISLIILSFYVYGIYDAYVMANVINGTIISDNEKLKVMAVLFIFILIVTICLFFIPGVNLFFKQIF